MKATKSVAEKPRSLKEFLERHKDSITSIIPEGTMNPDRFIQSALLAIHDAKNPVLATCTPESIYRSLKEAASYGFEVGGVLGQAYLIPYNESFKDGRGGWVKKMTCHFQMGYKGLITLARRSKTIKTISAEAVYANDKFEVQLGCGRKLIHSLDLTRDRGEVIGYYCLVELENDGVQFAVMSKKDVEKHRDTFSKAFNKDNKEANWNKNFDAMALKTCVIKALKLCPISIEALEAVRNEELAEQDIDQVSREKSLKEDLAKQAADDVDYEVVEEEKEQPREEPPEQEEPDYFSDGLF